jgi:hypothetical protein
MIDAMLLIISGPAIMVLGVYTRDSFMIGFGAINTTLYALAYCSRWHNQKRAARELLRKKVQLIEQFADEQERKSDQHGGR